MFQQHQVIRAIMLEDSLYSLHGLCTHEELIIEVDLHEYGAGLAGGQLLVEEVGVAGPAGTRVSLQLQ